MMTNLHFAQIKDFKIFPKYSFLLWGLIPFIAIAGLILEGSKYIRSNPDLHRKVYSFPAGLAYLILSYGIFTLFLKAQMGQLSIRANSILANYFLTQVKPTKAGVIFTGPLASKG